MQISPTRLQRGITSSSMQPKRSPGVFPQSPFSESPQVSARFGGRVGAWICKNIFRLEPSAPNILSGAEVHQLFEGNPSLKEKYDCTLLLSQDRENTRYEMSVYVHPKANPEDYLSALRIFLEDRGLKPIRVYDTLTFRYGKVEGAVKIVPKSSSEEIPVESVHWRSGWKGIGGIPLQKKSWW